MAAEPSEGRKWQRAIRAAVREACETWRIQAQAGPVTEPQLQSRRRADPARDARRAPRGPRGAGADAGPRDARGRRGSDGRGAAGEDEMRTGSQARDTFVPVALSDSACAIALGPTGVTHSRLRRALVQAQEEGWLSCSATESAYLLRLPLLRNNIVSPSRLGNTDSTPRLPDVGRAPAGVV